MQVSFLLPPGVGTSRALRVLVYPSYRVELASVSNPLQVRVEAPGADTASELGDSTNLFVFHREAVKQLAGVWCSSAAGLFAVLAHVSCASAHMCAFAVLFFGDDQDGSPAFFDYDAPTITAVVTSLVSNGSAAASDVVARLGPVDLADVRQVSVLGTNLGSAALLSGTGIGFALMVQERVPGQVGPDPAGWSPLPTPQVRVHVVLCHVTLTSVCLPSTHAMFVLCHG
jgi:hypothetical protein